MQVYKFEPTDFASNSFAVTADGKNCILIDCAEEEVLHRCTALGLTPKVVLLTHGHFDHVGGCAALQSGGVKIYCSEEESKNIFSEDYLNLFGGVYFKPFKIDSTLKESEYVFEGLKVRVINTPGHTSGSVCFIIENCLFSGDTLFFESVGRSDLPTGDWRALAASVKKLYALEGDYKIYCGHGEETSLEYERRNNGFIRE